MKNIVMESNNMNSVNFLTEDSISLTLEQVNLAAELSQTLATHPRQQWQAYLSLLAKLGTIEWLQQRAPELSLENDLSQVYASSIHQLQVGDFRLNIIVTDSSLNSEICVPRGCLEDSTNPVDFHVLIEVIEDSPVLEETEEQVNVAILGYLSPTQLKQNNPIILDDELALISTDLFEFKPDQLLLYLRCLEPEKVSQPQSITEPQESSQPILNVGNWLKNQLGQVAEELSWTLLPPLSYSSAFRDLRSPMELFSDAVTELRNQAQLVIPFEARTAYREIVWGDVAMRLYVTTWQIDTDINSPEWMLLLLLTAQPSSNLPVGTQLTVRDELQVLEEPVLNDPTKDYIYAQVIGAYNEPFYVTISLHNGTAITLPPFTFTR
jgi:hypothetical protein